MNEQLKEYRKEIQEIDDEITELLEERFSICWELGGFKKENGLPIYDAAQEAKKLALIEKNASEFNSEAIKNVFVSIMNESKKIQEEV